MITAKLSTEVQGDFIPDILKIDSKVYEEHLQGTYASVVGRYNANKESYILAVDESSNTIIGYLCFFPISNAVVQQMESSDEIIDDSITPEDIEVYEPEKSHSIYMISTVIESEYRDSGIMRQILNRFYRFLREKEIEGCKIESLLANAVTKDGIRLLERLNFTYKKDLQEGYKLFVCDKDNLNQLMNK